MSIRLKAKEKLFELVDWDMKALATLVSVSLSQAYRIRHGERGINEKFIVGTLTAFPEYRFEDLFEVVWEK